MEDLIRIYYTLAFVLVSSDCFGDNCIELRELSAYNKEAQESKAVLSVGELDSVKPKRGILVTPKVGDDTFMVFGLDGSGDWEPVQVEKMERVTNSDEK